MATVYLRAGHANPNDVVLRDPTLADAGGPPPITGTAAVTQAVSTTAASGVSAFTGDCAVTQAISAVAGSGVTSFVGSGAVTQAVSPIAASGVSSFQGTAAITQAVSLLAASGVSSFTGTAAVVQAPAIVTATGPTAFNGTGTVTQTVSATTASGTVSTPAMLPIRRFTRLKRLALPITGRARIRQAGHSVDAYGMVRRRRVGAALIVSAASAIVAFAALDDWIEPEIDELLVADGGNPPRNGGH